MNPLAMIEKPTKAQAIAALHDMREPSIFGPGLAAVVLFAIFGQGFLLCTGMVGVTLYLHRLWWRCSNNNGSKAVKPEQEV